MTDSNFIMRPMPRPNRHSVALSGLTTHAFKDATLFEELEAKMRLLGFSVDKAKELVDDFVVFCQTTCNAPQHNADNFLRKMTELAMAEGHLSKAEKRKLELERAEQVLKEPVTLEEVAVYVPVKPAEPFSQKAVRLTRENRHSLLAQRLAQRLKQKKGKK